MSKIWRPNYAFKHTNAVAYQKWWAQQDLNLRPIDYESSALTN